MNEDKYAKMSLSIGYLVNNIDTQQYSLKVHYCIVINNRKGGFTNMSIYDTIELHYQYLTNSEKKVADYYLVNRLEVVDKTLVDISDLCQVGEATVVRFCHKVGFKSFQDIRLKISLENSDTLELEPDNFVLSIKNNIVDVIEKTIEYINMDDMNKAIELINNSDKLMCFGVGSSGLSAEVMAMRFIRNGKRCQFISDPHFQAMYSVSTNEEDVIIAFSLSGRSKDTIHSVKLAKKNNSKIIIITNSRNSPLAKLGDVVLLTTKKNSPLNGGNLIAQINQIFIADVLTTGHSILNEKKTLEAREKTFEAIQEKLND